MEKAVVRPIAFKPVVPAKSQAVQRMRSSPDSSYDRPIVDDGYVSQDSRSCSHNSTMKESYSCRLKSDSPPSHMSHQYRSESQCSLLYHAAASSPSASSVEDFEIRLREKERELCLLREIGRASCRERV